MVDEQEYSGAMNPHLIVVLAAVFLSSCGTTGETDNQVRLLVGTIYVTGNEPFTKLALHGEDGNLYILRCEKTVEEELNQSQGRTYEIRFSLIEQLPDGPTIHVLSAKSVHR